MTPRQQALADVINKMYINNWSFTSENVKDAMLSIFYFGSNKVQFYIAQMSLASEKRFIKEVLKFLEIGVILDYSDFKPGGRYNE